MKLCHIVPSLEEQHGGPSKSVRALATALARLGNEIDLLSTRPGCPATPEASGSLCVRQFRRDRPEFLCPSTGLRDHLYRQKYDCIHHHSLWLRTLHYAHVASRVANTPLVVSPRGMMSDWAWNHHRWRKRLCARFVHPSAMSATRAWHATSDEERNEIRRHGFRQPICLAPNGVSAPTAEDLAHARDVWTRLCPEAANRPVALFYSRFHRKKRLLELMDLWIDAAPKHWLLLIAGVPEEYSVSELQSRIERSSASGRVTVLDGRNLPPPYAIASLFLLPSHGENFGLVIAEAMAWGVSVLVTDSTPWAGVTARKAGWCVPWDDYRDALRVSLGEGTADLEQRGARARRWVLNDFSWERAAQLLHNFYQQLSGHRHE